MVSVTVILTNLTLYYQQTDSLYEVDQQQQ